MTDNNLNMSSFWETDDGRGKEDFSENSSVGYSSSYIPSSSSEGSSSSHRGSSSSSSSHRGASSSSKVRRVVIGGRPVVQVVIGNPPAARRVHQVASEGRLAARSRVPPVRPQVVALLQVALVLLLPPPPVVRVPLRVVPALLPVAVRPVVCLAIVLKKKRKKKEIREDQLSAVGMVMTIRHRSLLAGIWGFLICLRG